MSYVLVMYIIFFQFVWVSKCSSLHARAEHVELCVIRALIASVSFFLSSDMARALWEWVAPFFSNEVWLSDHIIARLWNILSVSNLQSAFRFTGMYMVILMVWEVWKCRCAARFEGLSVSTYCLFVVQGYGP